MTESCFAIRGNGTLAGGCAALPKQQPTRIKQEKESMNKIVSVDGDTTFYGVIADLGLDFVHSPVHRIVFDIDQSGIQLLAERYPAQVFRTRHRSFQEKLTWRSLVLRFDKCAYVVAYGDGREWGEIIAPNAEAALALHGELSGILKDASSCG